MPSTGNVAKERLKEPKLVFFWKDVDDFRIYKGEFERLFRMFQSLCRRFG